MSPPENRPKMFCTCTVPRPDTNIVGVKYCYICNLLIPLEAGEKVEKAEPETRVILIYEKK